MQDWFELCLDRYLDLPSVALIRSVELKWFPRELLQAPALDLCCGDGFFTGCLGVKGAIGCDIDSRAIEAARRLTGTYSRVVNCDARGLKAFRNGAFKTVFSNCALEHVHGLDSAVASISRVLKKGGRFLMSVPGENLNNWFSPKLFMSRLGFSKYGQQLNDEYNKKQEHVNIYPVESWIARLKKSRLEVEKIFFLFRKEEYKKITFLESFVLDSFPGPTLRGMYSAFKKTAPIPVRKKLWRALLKPIYVNTRPRSTGAELFIIALKK